MRRVGVPAPDVQDLFANIVVVQTTVIRQFGLIFVTAWQVFVTRVYNVLGLTQRPEQIINVQVNLHIVDTINEANNEFFYCQLPSSVKPLF